MKKRLGSRVRESQKEFTIINRAVRFAKGADETSERLSSLRVVERRRGDSFRFVNTCNFELRFAFTHRDPPIDQERILWPSAVLFGSRRREIRFVRVVLRRGFTLKL